MAQTISALYHYTGQVVYHFWVLGVGESRLRKCLSARHLHKRPLPHFIEVPNTHLGALTRVSTIHRYICFLMQMPKARAKF